MASEPQKRLSAKTPVCVCLHARFHPTQRLCQLLREREIWGMHRDNNATPCMCVSVYLCQGGVRRQLRFHIAPRKRLELEACYNAKYTHIHAHIQEDIWGYMAMKDRQWKRTDNMTSLSYCFWWYCNGNIYVDFEQMHSIFFLYLINSCHFVFITKW